MPAKLEEPRSCGRQLINHRYTASISKGWPERYLGACPTLTPSALRKLPHPRLHDTPIRTYFVSILCTKRSWRSVSQTGPSYSLELRILDSRLSFHRLAAVSAPNQSSIPHRQHLRPCIRSRRAPSESFIHLSHLRQPLVSTKAFPPRSGL